MHNSTAQTCCWPRLPLPFVLPLLLVLGSSAAAGASPLSLVLSAASNSAGLSRSGTVERSRLMSRFTCAAPSLKRRSGIGQKPRSRHAASSDVRLQ